MSIFNSGNEAEDKMAKAFCAIVVIVVVILVAAIWGLVALFT